MCEISNELQEQLWKEACSFIETGSRKHLSRFGVTLEGSDNQYLELSFTCPCDDEDFEAFIDIIDNEFLQVVRFEYPNVRIQEFTCDIALEVSYDRYEWEHIVQLSIGNFETAAFNKFTYWKREHDKMTAGFRKSTRDFDTIYLASLKKMAKQLGISYDYSGNEIYEEMLVIERMIEEKFRGN